MKNVLICVKDFAEICPDAYERLKENGFSITENIKGYPYDFSFYADAIKETDYIIAGIESWNREKLDMAPKLKAISRFGSGIDMIDCDYAYEKDVLVYSALGGNSSAVAEQTIALIYGLLKKIAALDRSTKSGEWHRPFCEELSGKKIGFLGFGKIAQLVAHKLKTSDVTFFAYDIKPDMKQGEKESVAFCSMNEILSSCDIISIHMPITANTKGMIGMNEFQQMKPTAFLVNTARGAIVKQDDLYMALKTGVIAGAGLDVFETSSLEKGSLFAEMDNVVCSPYIASRTRESFRRVGMIAVENILKTDREP